MTTQAILLEINRASEFALLVSQCTPTATNVCNTMIEICGDMIQEIIQYGVDDASEFLDELNYVWRCIADAALHTGI